MAWDPKIYMAFGEERTRPARELLARIDANAPARVADLGCGPGNSTALLAARWPDSALEGVDNSAEMLAEAKASPVRAQWTLSDLAQWSPPAPCDVIFSNATLQWVPDHAELLPRLLRHVAPGGRFAFQIPRNFTEPCHTILHAVAENGPWREKLEGVRDRAYAEEPDFYVGVLEPLVKRIDIWETRYVQMLDGEDAVFRWMSGTGLRPFANALEGSEREAFLAEYRARVAQAYPGRASGVTLYPFQRLFCVVEV
jgi:trans-aconitate 2-methyltransferase